MNTMLNSAAADRSIEAPFGTLDEPHVITFPAGIPGFEACRRFVLATPTDLAPFSCLQALDPPAPSFLTVDPVLLDRGYSRALGEGERARIGAGEGDTVLWLAIVAVDEGGATANLRGPIVINPSRMVGCQLIRETGDYPVRLPIETD